MIYASISDCVSPSLPLSPRVAAAPAGAGRSSDLLSLPPTVAPPSGGCQNRGDCPASTRRVCGIGQDLQSLSDSAGRSQSRPGGLSARAEKPAGPPFWRVRRFDRSPELTCSLSGRGSPGLSSVVLGWMGETFFPFSHSFSLSPTQLNQGVFPLHFFLIVQNSRNKPSFHTARPGR